MSSDLRADAGAFPMSRTDQAGQAWTARAVMGRGVRGQRRLVVGAAGFFSGHQIGEALVPVVAGVVIDRAIATNDGGALFRWIVVLGIVFAGLSYSWRFGARISVRGIEGAAHDFRLLLAERVLDARSSASRGHLPGELLSIATADALQAASINVLLPRAVALSGALLVAMIVLLSVSIPLGLLVILTAPPLLFVMHLLSRPLDRQSSAEQASVARATGLAADLVEGIRVLKGIRAERPAIERYRQASRNALGATLRAARAEAGFGGVSVLFTGLFLAMVAFAGGRLAAEGQISIGQLIAVVGLAQFLLGPLSGIADLGLGFARVRASSQRIADVLAAPPAVTGGDRPVPQPVTGALTLHDVRHGSLRGVSLAVAPGEFVGIVAEDARDEQALLECLSRAVDPAVGVIELDGRPLVMFDPDALHAAILVAAHDAALFSGTLIENVSLPGVDAARRDAALVAAAVDDVVASLPEGLETPVSEGGRSLSGGQRQRVALARALAADSPVLVLHAPTTAIDSVTEARVATGIRAMREGRTTLVIATSPALLAACDRVVHLREGTIVREGPHQHLLAVEEYRQVVLV